MARRKTSKQRVREFLRATNEENQGDERKQVRRDYFWTYIRWLRPHFRLIVLLVTLSVGAAVLDMAHPLFMRYIVDGVLLGDVENGRSQWLHILGAIFLLVILTGQLTASWKNYRVKRLNTMVVLDLRKLLYRRIMQLPLQTLQEMKTGGVLSRLTDDVNTTSGMLQVTIISPAVAAFRLLLTLTILMVLNWQLALAALGVIPGIVMMSFLAVRHVRPLYRAIRSDNADIDGRTGEVIQGVKAIRAFGTESREYHEFAVSHHAVARKELRAYSREIFIWGLWSFMTASVSLIIVWFGGILYLKGKATIGDILAFQWYAIMLLNPVWQIVESFSDLQRSLAAVERVFEVMEMPSDKPDRADAEVAPSAVDVIEFEEVTFLYPDGTKALEEVSVKVPGGSTVAIVGRSGAGKTTLTDLVARFHDPSRGRVLLNGTDIRDLQKRSYRQLLGIVQQEVFLFDGTVRENIAYARPSATLDEVREAAERAHSDLFIDNLADGYDTRIGERGVKLSGGQRQRLAIARALLADPSILILDEATSNLDTESEQYIQASLAELLGGRTSIVIAHRLSTVRRADLILVLDGGRIIEQGTHEVLMDAQGHYAQMVLRQQSSIVL
jgi:ATP-binding cassette, subfamily B, bacterial